MRLPALIFFLAAWFVGAAHAAPLAPGEYIGTGGDSLEIKAAGSDGSQAFSIFSMGANAHFCDIQDSLRDGRAQVKSDFDDTCRIDFVRDAKGVQVRAQGEACRSLCGTRAWFEGLYYRPAPACTRTAVARTRDEFLKLYQGKQYAQARARLAPLLAQCGKLLYYTEDAEVRNDLAVTLYHLGERAACRRVLEPWRKVAAQSDAQINANYPPADAINFSDIAGKTRANLRLCRR